MSTEMSVSIDATNVQKAILAAKDWLAQTNMLEFLETKGVAYFHERFVHEFDNEVDPTGDPWLELLPSTHVRRALLGYPAEHPIHVRAGDLKREMLSNNNSRVGWTSGTAELTVGGPKSGGEYKGFARAQWLPGFQTTDGPRMILGLVPGIDELAFQKLLLEDFLSFSAARGLGSV